MEAVSKLNEDDAHVFGERQEHFTQVLDVALHTAVLQLAQFGDAVNELGYFRTKVPLNVFNGVGSFFRYVVE